MGQAWLYPRNPRNPRLSFHRDVHKLMKALDDQVAVAASLGLDPAMASLKVKRTNHSAESQPSVTVAGRGVMRRRILSWFGVLLVLALFYEISFRMVTAKCGRAEWSDWPPSVYYLEDTESFPWRLMCFGLRSRLPLGKVRLSRGSGYYVDGSRFYRKEPDGSFVDVTDWMAETRKGKP